MVRPTGRPARRSTPRAGGPGCCREMLDGHADSAIADGWRSTEVRDALDLCLACKGCKSDCPVGVDMATYKAEFLSHHFEGRLRPAAHSPWAGCRCGRGCPGWHRDSCATRHSARPASPASQGLAGVAAERDAPVFAEESFVQVAGAGSSRPRSGRPAHRPALAGHVQHLFHPNVAKSAVRVLEGTDFDVAVHQYRCAAASPGSRPANSLPPSGCCSTRSTCCDPGWRPAPPSSASNRPVRPSSAPTPSSCCRTTRCARRLAEQFRTFADTASAPTQQGWQPPSLAGCVGADPLPPARGDEGRRRPRTDAPRRDRRERPRRRLLRSGRQLRLRARPFEPVDDRGGARGAARRPGHAPGALVTRRTASAAVRRSNRATPATCTAPGRGPGARPRRTAPARRSPREARRPARGLRPRRASAGRRRGRRLYWGSGGRRDLPVPLPAIIAMKELPVYKGVRLRSPAAP